MYFMLNCFGPRDADMLDLLRMPQLPNVSWNSGQPIAANVPTPIRLELDPEQPGVMVPMFYKGILVFSDAMLAALDEAGVDNLDAYDAIIVDPSDGREYTGYKVVNIVGLISCADLSRSNHTAHGIPLIDVDFDSLTIDASKAHGALMFRLAENVAGIVVHQRVRRYLEQHGIEHLDFCHPNEWVG